MHNDSRKACCLNPSGLLDASDIPCTPMDGGESERLLCLGDISRSPLKTVFRKLGNCFNEIIGQLWPKLGRASVQLNFSFGLPLLPSVVRAPDVVNVSCRAAPWGLPVKVMSMI